MGSPKSLHPNSRAAWESAKRSAGGNRLRVMLVIEEHQPIATWEIDRILHPDASTRSSTTSATVTGLLDDALVSEVGTNTTPTGSKAASLAITGSDAHDAAVASGGANPAGGRRLRSAPLGGARRVITPTAPPATSPRRPDATLKDAAFLCEEHGTVLRNPVTIAAGFVVGVCPAHSGKGLSPAKVQSRRYGISA